MERTQKGNEIAENLYQISIAVAISDDYVDGPIVEPSTGAVIKKFRGLYRVEELRDLVEQEILGITGAGAKISVGGETLMQNLYPHFKSTMSMNFEYHKSLRDKR